MLNLKKNLKVEDTHLIYARKLLLILIDIILIIISIYTSLFLTIEIFNLLVIKEYFGLTIISLTLGVFIYILTSQYKGLTRYPGSKTLYNLFLRNLLLTILISTWSKFASVDIPSPKLWIIFLIFITFFSASIRIVMRDLLIRKLGSRKKRLIHVLIYGAGSAGAQLAASLKIDGKYHIDAFLDDCPQLWNRTINDVPILNPKKTKNLQKDVKQILFAIPSISNELRKKILYQLQKYNLPILIIPSIDDITSGRARIDSLRPIEIKDLLGRDSVPPDYNLLGPNIMNSVVCITGAGGSIGSELCRQVLNLNAKKLILIDHNEPSLYNIHQELINYNKSDIEIIPKLGSCSNKEFINATLKDNQINLLIHAAAYKHVPLVELNPIEGIYNNVFSTKVICEISLKSKVNQVLLISSDKAVRPTNFMGASKRISELIFQAFAQKVKTSIYDSKTLFSMVRFGNVLGSSGSVVPLFNKQIAKGGPITLTHENIIRYFMTIQEASQLVLQSSLLAQGGDVFLLDMGEPVLIKELAEQMISLSGLSKKDENNPTGDIEILISGLRPGEKLYEELLIDAKSIGTSHPLIYRAQEQYLTYSKLIKYINDLEESLKNHNLYQTIDLIKELVPEWINRKY